MFEYASCALSLHSLFFRRVTLLMLPKISVVTATYNSEKTLRSTLDSLKNQTYANFEHVVVDGFSTDDTLQIISESGVCDAIVDCQRDDGIYCALNRGIGLATGDVVGFLHSDDFFPNSGVLAMIAEVFVDPSVDICFGDLAYVSRANEARVVRRWKSGSFQSSRLRFGWMPPHPTFYVRRELLQRHLFNLEYRISADYDAMLRLLTSDNNVCYIPHELVHMRLGGASNKSVSNILKKIKEDWRSIKSNGVGGPLTLLSKNLRKLPQFFNRES